MNGFAVAGLFFVAIPCAFMAVFVLIKEFKERKSTPMIWVALLLSIALWGFGMYKIGTATDQFNAYFWWRIAEIGVILIPVLLTHFVISYLGLNRKIFLAIFYLLTFIYLFFNFYTGFFIKDLYFAFGEFYYIVKTPLYSIFICIFIASVLYILFELIKSYNKAKGEMKSQIKYLIWVFAVGFSGGITSYFPVYNINIYPIWNGLITISVILVTYIIYKHHFMDIRIIATELFASLLVIMSINPIFEARGIWDILLKILYFIVTLVFAILLIRSVLQEVRRREEMETLNKKLNQATKELSKANQELKRLDESKSEFLSISSHQLRTPLTIIKGYSSMLMEGNFGKLSKPVKDSVSKIFISTERLIGLVESLLNISRIEAGRIDFTIESVDLTAITKSMVNDFQEKAKARKLKLAFQSKEKMPKVLADAQKIKDVVSNLLDNAIKYTKKGEIMVGLHQEGQSVVFTSQDTGIGLDVDDIGRLFNKFTRGKDSSKVNTEGTGLGLYYARVLVENMGGRIWVESPGKDKGSKFSFSLPLADKKQAKKISS